MRKNLLILALSIASIGACAQNQPAAQWASLMGGSQGDQSTSVAIDAEDNALWLSTAASTEAAPEIFYNGQEIFQGALYNAGNSSNNNLSLICTDPDGAIKWQIYSTSGDYASGQGNVAVDNQGNIVFTAKVRHTDGMTDKPVNIIDATGKEHEIMGAVEKRFYQLVVIKCNSNGELLWTKLVEVSNASAPAASGSTAGFTPDAISSTALAIDDDNNIYFGGNYCSTITIDGVSLEPVNVSTWTGDSQASCGNMMLVKLDENGQYVDSRVGVGEIGGYSSVIGLEWHDGALYFVGAARGEGEFSFAGAAVVASDVLSPILGRIDANLIFNWIKCCESQPVDDKTALQNMGITLCGDNLWLCGQYNQKIIDPENPENFVAATQGKLREGFIVKFDKNSGQWQASADSKDGFEDIAKLTGYFKAVQSPEHLDKVYVYGYVMDANIGIFLREYDAADLTPVVDNAWSLATGGGVPTAVAIAYSAADGVAYISGRGNKAFSLIGGVETEATKNWDVLMAKLAMPEDLTSAIADITIMPTVGNDDVYDIYGRKVKNAENLLPGIYVSNNRKFIVR